MRPRFTAKSLLVPLLAFLTMLVFPVHSSAVCYQEYYDLYSCPDQDWSGDFGDCEYLGTWWGEAWCDSGSGGGGGGGGGGGPNDPLLAALLDDNGDGKLDCWKDTVTGYSTISETNSCNQYGSSSPPCGHSWPQHMGQDIAAECGNDVRAVGNGTITEVGYSSCNGNYIREELDDGTYAIYLHLRDAPLVQVHDSVHVTDKIGVVGQTGCADGCHLHLQMQTGSVVDDFNQTLDPRSVLGNC